VNIIVIDPTTKRISAQVAESYEAIRHCLLNEDCAVVHLSDTQLLLYQPFACANGSHFFFSRKMEQHYAGVAVVAGASVDGYPVSVGRGMLQALQNDILFLGDVEQAKRTLSKLAKFSVGTLRPHRTLQ
jgi:hypothetical protein